jgi:hypothetical protein
MLGGHTTNRLLSGGAASSTRAILSSHSPSNPLTCPVVSCCPATRLFFSLRICVEVEQTIGRAKSVVMRGGCEMAPCGNSIGMAAGWQGFSRGLA